METWEEKLMDTGAVSPPVATVPALIPTFITHRGPPMMRPPPQYPLDAYPTAYAYANQYGYATAMPGAPPELLPPPPTEAYMPVLSQNLTIRSTNLENRGDQLNRPEEADQRK
ncbi:hypothetical protein Pelo_7222 [Pelomyxa schiedti]|nr:hypothetical protein Pelo_7222 [Pelomyxa schiedti]